MICIDAYVIDQLLSAILAVIGPYQRKQFCSRQFFCLHEPLGGSFCAACHRRASDPSCPSCTTHKGTYITCQRMHQFGPWPHSSTQTMVACPALGNIVSYLQGTLHPWAEHSGMGIVLGSADFRGFLIDFQRKRKFSEEKKN